MEVGRRFKIDSNLIIEICRIISNGNTFKTASALVGISESLFHNYLRTARAVIKERKEGVRRRLSTKEGKAIKLLQSVKKAEAEAIQRNVNIVNVAAQNSWQAAAWWLERRYPKDYARKEYIDYNGPISTPLNIIFAPMTKEQFLDNDNIEVNEVKNIENKNDKMLTDGKQS